MTSQTPYKGVGQPQGQVDHTLRTTDLDKNTEKIWSQTEQGIKNDMGTRVTRPRCDPGSDSVELSGLGYVTAF